MGWIFCQQFALYPWLLASLDKSGGREGSLRFIPAGVKESKQKTEIVVTVSFLQRSQGRGNCIEMRRSVSVTGRVKQTHHLLTLSGVYGPVPPRLYGLRLDRATLLSFCIFANVDFSGLKGRLALG